MVATGGGETSRSTVELVITASDKASKTTDQISESVSGIGKAATAAIAPVTALGGTIATLAQKSFGQIAQPFLSMSAAATAAIAPVTSLGSALGQLVVGTASNLGGVLLTPFSLLITLLGPLTGIVGSVTGAFGGLQRTFQEINANPVAAIAIADALEEAERAVESLDSSLTETFAGVKEVGGDLFKGAIPALDEFQGRTSAVLSKFTGSFASAASRIGPSLAVGLNAADRLIQGVLDKAERIPAEIAGNFDAVSNVFFGIAGFDEPLTVFENIRGAVGSTTSGIFQLTQEIAFFSAGLDALKQFVVSGPFELLIGQNVSLREQLLATQSSLVATNKIIQNGQEIKDPTTAIKALDNPVKQAISDLREGSLDLVGVTSNDLVPLFQQVAQASSSIGASLSDSKDLSLSFAASLGTLSIPLAQSRQEIGSILSGTIDMNSVLAKSLGINNEMVSKWKSQGTVVQELQKKLAAFRSGNALAAATISGVTSNIEEVFQEIGRIAGEPLLEPIVKELTRFYDFLKANKDALAESVGTIVGELLKAGQAAVRVLESVFTATQGTLAQIPIYLFKSLANGITSLAESVEAILPALEPVITVFGQLAEKALPLSGIFLKIFLFSKVASTGVNLLSSGFGILTQTLPGIGELLFFLTGRNSSLLKSFIGLRSELGLGAAGFLTMGKNLQNIPGLFGLLAAQIPIFGGAIASFVPQLSQMAIQGVGLLKVYPQVGTIFQNLTTLLPTAAAAAAPFADKLLPGLGDNLKKAADLSKDFGSALAESTTEDRVKSIERLSGATGKFSGLMQMLGGYLAQTVLRFALLTGGIYLAIQLFDRFILKNRDLLDTLGALFQGLQDTAGALINSLKNPIVLVTVAIAALTVAIKAQLLPALIELIGTQLLTWANSAVGAVFNLAAGLQTLGFAGLASSANKFATSLNALILVATQGPAAAASMLAYTAANEAAAASATKTAASNGLLSFSFSGLWKNIVAATLALIRFSSTAITSAVKSMTTLAASVATGTFSFGAFVAGAKGALVSTIAFGKAALAGSGGLTALVPALGAGTTGLTAFASSAALAAGSFIALVAPIAAVAAAIGSIALFNYSQVLADSTEATELYRQQTDALSSSTIQFAEKLKSAKNRQAEANKKGVRLTDEEYKANERLQKQAIAQIDTIDSKIADLKQAQKEVRGEGNKAAIEAQVNQLEKLKGTLQAFSSDIQIAPQDLPKLGSALDQLTQKAKGAEEAITKSSGDPVVFKAKVEELIAATEQQLKLGQISESEARRRLGLIAGNVNVEADLQIKAQQSITASYEAEAEKRIEGYGNEITKIEGLAATGLITQADADKKVTELKDKELKERLESVRRSLTAEYLVGQENGEKAIALRKQEAELQSQIDKNAAQGRLREIDNAQKKALETVKAAEAKRIIEIQRLENSGDISKQEAEKLRTDATKTRIDAELEAEKTRLTELESNSQVETEEIRNSRQKILDLTNQSLQAEQKAYDSHIATVLSKIDRQQTESLVATQKSLNQGVIDTEQAEEKKAQLRLDRLNKELALETKDKDKQIKLQLQVAEAEKQLQDARINRRKAALERSQTEAEIALQKRINQGAASEEQADEERAVRRIERLKQEMALAVNNKDEQLKLQLEVAQAEKQLQDSRIANRRAALQRAQSEAELLLTGEVRRGVKTQAEADAARAQLTVNRVRKELELEKNNKDKQLQLRKELSDAEGQLQDALLTAFAEKLNRQAKAYENSVAVQNRELERQLRLYDVLNSALENRAKLTQASKDLSEATSNLLVGELQILSDGERSEFRKRQLAEITATIKLESLRKQQEFERQIFEIQQDQNRLAVERQRIEAQIAITKQQAEIKRGDAEVKIAERQLAANKISKEEFEAVKLTQSARFDELGALQQQATLIEKQAALQPQIEAAERKRLQLQQQLAETGARSELAKSLPPGLRERAQRSLADERMRELFGVSREEFFAQGVTRSRQTAAQEFKVPTRGNALSAFDPELEGLSTVLGGRQLQNAARSVEKSFNRAFGPAAGQAGGAFIGIPAGTKALALPEDFEGLKLQPSETKVALPPAQMESTKAIAAGQAQKMDKLIQAVEATSPIKAGAVGGLTIQSGAFQITVQASDAEAGRTIANQAETFLTDVIKRAAELAGVAA